MDRGKSRGKSTAQFKTNKIYMDLKGIIREHALRYLPAKSLHRFKAVCKDWKLLISTPFFEHNQSVAFCSTSGLFCQSPEGSISFISFEPTSYGIVDPALKFLPEPVDLLASSHGLVCCRGRSGDKAYYICNPVNQQWKKLPKPRANHGRNTAVALVFEPSLLNFVADYKLICAFPSTDFDGAYEFEIYASTEDSWKISSEICFGEYARQKNRAKVLQCYGLYGRIILGIMDGKLCASVRRGSEMTSYVLSNEYANTMQMQAEIETWETKTIRISDAHTSTAVHESEGILLAVGGDVVLFPDGRNIFSYDMRTKETKKVTSVAEFSHGNVCVPYVNSIVCLK